MTRVFLLSSFERPEEDTHWASPYYALRRAFAETPSSDCELVDSPDAADLILVCPRPRNPVFPIEIFRHGIAWKHRRKCVVISTDDHPTLTHKGFYTCLRASATSSPWLKGGFYPFVTYSAPEHSFPLDADHPYLFSFLGSFRTHPVRQRIGNLAASSWRETVDRFFVKDTSTRDPKLGETEFRDQYLHALRDSKFILCPRGMCPSSVRLFETMKAGRVPVIISDEWVPPPDVQWDRFAVFVKEADISEIPRILRLEESSFAERATVATQEWGRWFAGKAMADTVCAWGMALVEESTRGGPSLAHVMELLRQLIGWHFIRRGLASEIRRVFFKQAA